MTDFDLVVANGTIAVGRETFRGDLGIKEGRIAAIAERIPGGGRRIDAGGRLVLPGGIEAHCHIAQESSSGVMTADDYYTGSVSAAFGGNSCFVPFAAQHRGQTIASVLATYDGRAAPNAVIDYSYHLIVSDPTPTVLHEELPAAFARGITSFKVFMTYDLMRVGDAGLLDILTVAKAHGALTMVHAENNDMVKWMNGRLAAVGATEPRFHAISRPELAEEEAIHRAVCLAKLVDAPLFVVHVSTQGGAEIIQRERQAGTRLFAETCPQYLALTCDDLDRPGMEGAKFMCSPPLRDRRTQDALWRHIAAGTFDSVSSDHAPYRFDASGKFFDGAEPPYPRIANGMPGIAARLPYLFSEGVVAGRISLAEFVALSAGNAARVFGLPRKGALVPGFDADIAIWDPEARYRVALADQHDAMDYTPFEGLALTGRPVTLLSRGRPIVEDGRLVATRGTGRFVSRTPSGTGGGRGHRAREFETARRYGREIAP